MKSKEVIVILTTLIVALFPVSNLLLAQEEGEVVDIGTVEIHAEATQPTVVTTIERQKPDIDIGELRRPEEGKIFNQSSSIKPRLADIEVKKVKKPKKILAKKRKH